MSSTYKHIRIQIRSYAHTCATQTYQSLHIINAHTHTHTPHTQTHTHTHTNTHLSVEGNHWNLRMRAHTHAHTHTHTPPHTQFTNYFWISVKLKKIARKSRNHWWMSGGGVSTLGSENRDRGGIQSNSEPTSTPSPLLKINTNYVGFSGLSNL